MALEMPLGQDNRVRALQRAALPPNGASSATRAGGGETPTPLIRVSGLRKEYRVNRTESVVAIDRVDFDVVDGEFVTLVGPSGCGKSTLLQILAGILPATRGEISLNGRTITGPRREAGVVFQEAVLLPWLKVIDNVLLPAVVHKLDHAKFRKRAMELLSLVKLRGFENRYPYELSGRHCAVPR